jgi:putative membrane protein insertion efficiency factor
MRTNSNSSALAENASSNDRPPILFGTRRWFAAFSVAVVRSFTFLAQLPARALLAAIWIYQRSLSPALPVFLGPSCGCRFAPTCSHYAVDAVRAHGAVMGGMLTLIRILKCTPLHPGGFDPVPVSPSLFSCVRIDKTIPVEAR